MSSKQRSHKEVIDVSLTITTLYSIPLVLTWLILWMGVTRSRAGYQVSIGDAGNPHLLLQIRRHGNFIEWVPLVLVLMLLAEAQGTSGLWLHAAGALLLIGRWVHPFGLKIGDAGHPLRYVGNGTNLLAAAILLIALIRIATGL
jgi:uncharacterized membrane protein YecN with MAPEG domain